MLLVATVISSGAACQYGADGKCFDDTLSREISHLNAARAIRGGDFSTPLRFGRNDGRAQAGFSVIWGREISPLRFASVEMTIGVSANTVISSGVFMRRLSRGVLFCPLHRGGKGTRFVRKQSDLRIV